MRTTSTNMRRADLPLLAVLLVALVVRLLLWGQLPRTGLISDEGEYLSAASWLAHGRSFSWYQGYLWTRAPLYPLFVAAHLRLFGDTPAPVYLTQTLLSLLNVALVYALALRLLPEIQGHRFVATCAALLMAVYLPFASYPQALLSETLFITLLLGGFLALAVPGSGVRGQGSGVRGQRRQLIWLVLAGGLFGLATLTRSLTLAFLPLVALWLALGAHTPRGWWWLTRQGVLRGAIFLLCAGAVILPWTIYNSSSRLYNGLVVVDTSGAFNLLLGARTAADGGRSDAPTRDYVLVLLGQKKASEATVRQCLPYPNPLPASQGARQAAMTSEGLCLIRGHLLAFAQKSLVEFIDFFQINYTGAERFANGFGIGRLPRWYALSLFLLDDTIYVLVLPLAVLGWALLRRLPPPSLQSPAPSLQSLIGLWWLYNLAVAPLLFAINRFRLPLLPFAFLFAGYALCALGQRGWRAPRSRYGWACAALALLLVLVAATPYAYLEPRADGDDSAWASYLGPYPSSLADTLIAWRTRPGYLRDQQVMRALGAGDQAAAQTLLKSSDVTTSTLSIAQPLIAGLQGRPEAGLVLLPPLRVITATKQVELAVVRGDLLRRAGDIAGARFTFTQRLIDDANPVSWAWNWLHPAPLPNNHIDLAGNLDLGYIDGCYLGEGDNSLDPPANFRWCTDGARLRFPSAGTGAPQTLVLRADGRGWFDGLLPVPPVRVSLGDQLSGSFTPDAQGVGEFSVALPPSPAGTDVIVTLRTDTFVPSADRYLSQQGRAVVGQVQRLGVRLDWAELR